MSRVSSAKAPPSSDPTPSTTGERVQKIIAQAGIASRRDAEELIREGKVTVNGKTAKLGDKATLGVDSIKVRGKLIHSTEQKVYYIIYKPKNMIGMITEDEEGRPTLHEFTKRIKERVFTVGRMDFVGEGAILLTNDGEIAQKLQKSNDIIRRYHVKVDRHPTPVELEKLARGGRIEGQSMQPFHVRLVNNYTRNALIEISFEGMSALDIRKFFENKGFFPERVACVGIGHISAEKMAPGAIKKLEGSSVKALFTQPELTKKIIDRLMQKRAHAKDPEAEEKKSESSDSATEAAPKRRISPGRTLPSKTGSFSTPRITEAPLRGVSKFSSRPGIANPSLARTPGGRSTLGNPALKTRNNETFRAKRVKR